MDRIFEAYSGTGGFSREFSRKSRERIHWTCSQVWGGKVLDIGCSQGIGTILLGRMGYNVLGLDINPEAIEFAKRELSNETEEIRRKVLFSCENFLQFKNEKWSQVDAIVMGEVLEHLVRPADFVAKAFRLLKPAGRLIVTVPFGINDDPDHRQTFYLTNIYTLLYPFFDIAGVKFFGSWIGFVARRREEKISELPQIPLNLFRQAEEAFYGLERPLRDDLMNVRSAVKRANEETAAAKASVGMEVEVVETRVSELKTELEVERGASRGYQEQIAVLKTMLQVITSQQKSAVENAANDQRLLAYSQETRELLAENGSLKTALAVAKVERSHLEDRLLEVEVTVDCAEKNAAETKAMAEMYEAENANLRAEIESRKAESQAAIMRIAEERTRLDQALAQMRMRFSESQEETTALRAKLSRVESTSKESIKEIETLKRDILRLKESNAALDLEVRQARNRLASDGKLLDKARNDNAALQSLVSTTSDALAVKDGVNADLEKKVASLSASVDALNSDVSQKKAIIANLSSRARKAVSDYGKMKQWFLEEQEKCSVLTEELADVKKQRDLFNRRFRALANSKLGRLTLAYWKLKRRIKGVGRIGVDKPIVSIVIPAYKETQWLHKAIGSAVDQNLSCGNVQVLVCVNGPDADLYRRLRKQYAKLGVVEVYYTKDVGANAGRNLGISHAKAPFLTFLDSDDYLTPGYLKEMISDFKDPSTSIVVGRLVDEEESAGKQTDSTYINTTLESLGGKSYTDFNRVASVFSSFCMKVYRTDVFRRLGPLPVGDTHTEDVLFWAERIATVEGAVYLSKATSKEAYVRRMTSGSLSRPAEDKRYSFFVTDRLAILDKLTGFLLNVAKTESHRLFILNKIKAQTAAILRFINSLDEGKAKQAREEVVGHKNIFLNKSLFSTRTAIAFCHNFSPYVDASAFVATKRLREIGEMEGGALSWNVISQDMSKIRSSDMIFQRYYADFVYTNRIQIAGSSGFAPKAQLPYVTSALVEAAKFDNVDVIYSRALFVGSHMAAYEYKKLHPKVKWYAEFSDPLSMGVDDKPRTCLEKPSWNDVEQMVYELADVIIFTNENQLEYMLSYNPNADLNSSIRKRAVIRRHPKIDHDYCYVAPYDYAMDKSKINIGFFGTFYITRKADDLLSVMSNPEVVLHIFTTKPDDLKELVCKYPGRIRVNNVVSQFEFLNLASRMDYLILTDTEFPGSINPFLPSKYADYLVTGTRIIAKVANGSALSVESVPRLIKVKQVDDNFVRTLSNK